MAAQIAGGGKRETGQEGTSPLRHYKPFCLDFSIDVVGWPLWPHVGNGKGLGNARQQNEPIRCRGGACPLPLKSWVKGRLLF